MTDDLDDPAGAPPEPLPPAAPPPPPPPAAPPPPLAAAPPPLAVPTPPPMAAAAPPAPAPAPPAFAPAPPAAPAPVADRPAKQPPWPWIIAGFVALALGVIAILYFTGVLGARAPSLLGTWSPACTDGRAQALIFTGDNRVITSGGTLAWSQSGDTVTLSSPTGGGPRVVLRWESLAEGRARVTEVASGQSNILNRCG